MDGNINMMHVIENFSVYLIVILAVSVIIFLICREIICWYFKINQRVSQQTLIIDLLKDIKTSLNQSNKQVGSQSPQAKSCKGCGATIKEGSAFCEQCGAKL